MSSLLDKVHDNLPNYPAVAELPSFRLFSWFFVIPGVLIAGLAASDSCTRHRHVSQAQPW